MDSALDFGSRGCGFESHCRLAFLDSSSLFFAPPPHTLTHSHAARTRSLTQTLTYPRSSLPRDARRLPRPGDGIRKQTLPGLGRCQRTSSYTAPCSFPSSLLTCTRHRPATWGGWEGGEIQVNARISASTPGLRGATASVYYINMLCAIPPAQRKPRRCRHICCPHRFHVSLDLFVRLHRCWACIWLRISVTFVPLSW